ncbi:cysteine proteinase [Ceratobasidium sp. AG-I]|nr:cysteine proteinase [Ceratobasidium sp. AG-I]
MTVKAPSMSNISVTESYEKAVKKCRDRVSWIAEHYRLRNQRFRDREFDVEKDLVRCLYYYQQTEDLSRQPKDMLRITQIFDQPDFSLEIAKTSDLVQGNLDNCWFVSALSMVASKPELMGKICIAHDVNVGVYGFVFFKNGQWIDVIIDDILAVKVAPWDRLNSSEKAIYHDNREGYNKIARKGSKILSFAAAVEEGVTLFPLVEKAFAKAHGDYGSLNHGYCHEGIEDLTGGVAISMATKDIMDPDKFWEDELMKANKDRMFGCSVDYNGNALSNQLDAGLRGSHAYAITDVHEIDDHGKPRRFVRIRNPWGRSEWTGRWSDGSKEWTKEWLGRLDELGHSFGDDGEFLMEYDDFLTTWHDIQRCILFDDSWQMSVTWINASIRPPPCNWCYGDVSFTVEATQPTPTVFVLSQIDSRYFRGSRFSTTWHMDFKVYRHSEEDVETPRIVEESYPDPNPGSRSVSVTFNLEPGKYVVHASTSLFH